MLQNPALQSFPQLQASWCRIGEAQVFKVQDHTVLWQETRVVHKKEPTAAFPTWPAPRHSQIGQVGRYYTLLTDVVIFFSLPGTSLAPKWECCQLATQAVRGLWDGTPRVERREERGQVERATAGMSPETCPYYIYVLKFLHKQKQSTEGFPWDRLCLEHYQILLFIKLFK